jgi:hypothetical protein
MSYCGTYVGVPNYGAHVGPYASTASLPCSYTLYYDRWSFQAPADEYAYVTVDTIADATKFDPDMFIVDSTSCLLGNASSTFTCTYSPAIGSCGSYYLPVTKGEIYDVIVMAHTECSSTIGEYELSVDTSSDPALTLEADDRLVFGDVHIQITGSASL